MDTQSVLGSVGSGRWLAKIGLYTTLLFFSALTLTPMVWLIAAVFKRPEDLFSYLFFPPLNKLSVGNFENLFTMVPFGRYLVNGLFVTATTVLLQLFFAALGGFALAKYEFKGKRIVMAIMLGTMMIPGQVLLAPMYELIYRLGLMDRHLGLIVPAAVSVFGMFLFRQAMLQLPDELLEAGRMDGCSEFGLFWNIALPVSRPMMGAFCLISFMSIWNGFLWPQLILHSKALFTPPIGLSQLMTNTEAEYGAMLAGTLLSILPVMIMFLLLQKEFIGGLTAGAVKG